MRARMSALLIPVLIKFAPQYPAALGLAHCQLCQRRGDSIIAFSVL